MPRFQSRRDGFSFPACPPYVRDGAKESGERGDGSASVTLDRLPISLHSCNTSLKQYERRVLGLINIWKPGRRFRFSFVWDKHIGCGGAKKFAMYPLHDSLYKENDKNTSVF